MGQFRLCHHAKQQAERKGVAEAAILQAANQPSLTYDNRRHPGQRRHVRGDICAVVDPDNSTVVTFYTNVEETPLRPDQTDKDALAYGRRVKQTD